MMKKIFLVVFLLSCLYTPASADNNPSLQLQINPSSGTGGGGGGGGSGGSHRFTSSRERAEKEQLLQTPSTQLIHCAFYDSYSLSGTLGTPNQTLTINGSSENIAYIGNIFQTLLPLVLGDNLFYLQSFLGSDESPRLEVLIHRQGLGDADDNKDVDDYDLSLVASTWGSSNCTTDFNHDSIVDDYDLSILASHWNFIY